MTALAYLLGRIDGLYQFMLKVSNHKQPRRKSLSNQWMDTGQKVTITERVEITMGDSDGMFSVKNIQMKGMLEDNYTNRGLSVLGRET